MFTITLTAQFDTYDAAVAALRNCEEVVGKHDGEIDDTRIDDSEEM